MSVQRIIALIEREADEEATRIVDDAERDAQEAIAAAEAAVQARVDAATERLGPDIRAGSQRRINAVRLRILEERARDDAARLTAVFGAAETQVAAVAEGADPPRWASALRGLCIEALGSVGEGATVTLRARDAAVVSGPAADWKATVETVTDEAPPGVVVRSRGGRIEVDARIPVRVERARSLLAEAVARLLALESVEAGRGAAP